MKRALGKRKSQAFREELDLTFHALSDPTRRAILARLSKGGSSVTELARPFIISLPGISKHLNVLENAELINREKDGRFYRLSINPKPLAKAASWIALYRPLWEKQLDSLESYLKSPKDTGKNA